MPIGGNTPDNPTWNRDYPYEDINEYTSCQVTVKVADTRFSIFPHHRDAYYYWKKLRHDLHGYGCELVEYMTMGTHVHFLALTQNGPEPLIKAIRATNISYSMRLRYYAKHPRPYKVFRVCRYICDCTHCEAIFTDSPRFTSISHG